MASGSGKTAQPSGACNGTAADLGSIEQELYDYQMHTKMCKKIAQLTKILCLSYSCPRKGLHLSYTITKSSGICSIIYSRKRSQMILVVWSSEDFHLFFTFTDNRKKKTRGENF